MERDIGERLLEQAAKFHRWQEAAYPGKAAEEIGGAWEVDYPAWDDIFDAFCHVLTDLAAEQAEKQLLTDMLYLIARDNEGEGLIQRTVQHSAWFEVLCRCAVRSSEPEAKWQFAAYLPECSCNQEVKDMILDFANILCLLRVNCSNVDCRKLFRSQVLRDRIFPILIAVEELGEHTKEIHTKVSFTGYCFLPFSPKGCSSPHSFLWATELRGYKVITLFALG